LVGPGLTHPVGLPAGDEGLTEGDGASVSACSGDPIAKTLILTADVVVSSDILQQRRCRTASASRGWRSTTDAGVVDLCRRRIRCLPRDRAGGV